MTGSVSMSAFDPKRTSAGMARIEIWGHRRRTVAPSRSRNTGSSLTRLTAGSGSLSSLMLAIPYQGKRGTARRSQSERGLWRASTSKREVLLFLVTVCRHIAGGAVIFVRQEFSRHRDLHPIPFRVGLALHRQIEIDRRHDAVAELLLDQNFQGRAVDHHQFIKPIDERISRRHL